MTEPVLYFGKHKGQPLSQIPADYLAWVLREVKLSSGLRAAVVADLQRRGAPVPDQPPPRPEPCRRCGADGWPRCTWLQMRDGRKQITADCAKCGARIFFAPQVEPYVSLANATASKMPILEVLNQADELGVTLRSDGKGVVLAGPEDWKRVTPRFRELLRQCQHDLAGLIGKRLV